MKKLLVLVLISIAHFSFAKEEIPTLQNADGIALHNTIQSTIESIDNQKLSPTNLDGLKTKLEIIVKLTTEMSSITKIKDISSSYSNGFEIIYDFNDYRYYYDLVEIDSNLIFYNLKLGFSKYQLIDNEDHKMVYNYNYSFNHNYKLDRIEAEEPKLSRVSEYDLLGRLRNHKLDIDGKIVGKTYTSSRSSSEMGVEMVSELLNSIDYEAIMIMDYDSENLEGTELMLYGSDTVSVSKGNFNKNLNQKQGKWLTYYKNGNLALTHVYEFFDDKYYLLNGKEIYFYKNGDTAQISQYVFGKLNGEKLNFYPKNKAKWKELYDNDFKVGEQETYFKDGSISSRSFFSTTGEKVGEWLVYDMNKKLISVQNYKNDHLNGLSKIYSKGVLVDSCVFVDGNREGSRVKYYDYLDTKNQIIINELSNYNQGKLHGIYISYYSDGSIADSSFYISGKKDGKSTQYYENGNMSKLTHYKSGVTQNYTMFYKNGNKHKVSSYDPTNDHSKDTMFYENGIIGYVEAYDEKGTRFGDWIAHDEDGTLTSQITYGPDNAADGFEIEIDNDKLDSTFYNSDLMIRTSKTYYDSKLFYKYSACYGIPISHYHINWVQKEAGLINKSTYYIDPSELDNPEDYHKSYKKEYQVGEETSYYSNGSKKKVIIIMDSGDEWASQAKYYKNGNLKQIIQNSNWDSYKIANFNENGQVLSYKSEENETAKFYEYYKNANLKSKIIYESDFLLQTNYYENGNIKYSLKEEESGMYDFYKNKYDDYGSFYTKKELFYDENGVLTLDKYSSDNDEEKIIKKYKNGKLESIERYEDTEGYGAANMVKTETFYQDGTLKSLKNYEYSESNYENTLVYQRSYYESGGIKLEKRWDENGLKYGIWKYYYDDEERNEAGEVTKKATIKEQH